MFFLHPRVGRAVASAFEAEIVGRHVLVGKHVLAAQNAWVEPSGDRVGVRCGASVNFFKSMAKTIKANRASKAGAEVVDDKACTHYTGHYTPNSCGEKSHYVNWIEGGAMRARVELKFGFLHERMLTHP